MKWMDFYKDTCFDCSKVITERYSTSFSMGIKAFHPRFQMPIYGLYAFVRFADEIVDTFHEFDKKDLIACFKKDAFDAIHQRVSLNPVLHAFQNIVNTYGIDPELISAFLKSMEMDLAMVRFQQDSFQEYIYGSAEVVGLMCLKIFCEGDEREYMRLAPMAKNLGSAFQKVNFLRDIKDDYHARGRIYFPSVDFTNFDEATKEKLQLDILNDLNEAYKGIKLLPNGVRLGVYLAYRYYLQLLKKITRTPAKKIINARVRVPNAQKFYLLAKAVVRHRLNAI